MLHKHIHFSVYFSHPFLFTVRVKLVFFNSEHYHLGEHRQQLFFSANMLQADQPTPAIFLKSSVQIRHKQMHFPIHNNSTCKAAVQKHNKNPTPQKKSQNSRMTSQKQSCRTSTSPRPKLCCLLSKNTALLRHQLFPAHTPQFWGARKFQFLTKATGRNVCL